MRNLKILTICLIIFSSIGLQIPFNENKASAAPKVEYLGSASYGVYRVGKFKVDGRIAFCMDHYKPTPGTGSEYSPGKLFENEKVLAILYYGAGGPENEVGTSDTGIIATSLALDSVINGNHSDGRNSVPGYEKLMNHADKKDAPDDNVSFSKNSVSSNISGDVQKSETIKFIADTKNSINIKVPSNVILHMGSKSYESGTATIKGGQSFYFTADLDYGGTVSIKNIGPKIGPYQSMLFIAANSSLQRLTNGMITDPVPMETLAIKFEVRNKKINIEHKDEYNDSVLEKESYTRSIGSDYSFSPKKSITKNNNTYVPVSDAKKTGTLGTKDITLTFWYSLEREIAILHKDARDGKLLASQTDTKKRGDKYSYSPKTNLKKGEYTYRPVSTATKTGTVGGSNITITFYYDVPLIKSGLEKIQVYTAPANKGLPVKVNLSKVNIYPDSNEDMADAKINVSLYQGSTKIVTNAYTAKTLPKSIDLTVPSSKLAINQKKGYTVKLEGFSKNEMNVISDATTITTDGYTSSEKNLNVNNISTFYTGVIMTEREIRKDMVVFNESLNVNLKKLEKKLTGYGFIYPVNVVYKNDLGQKFTSNFDFYVPKSLLDNYLSYPVSDNLYKISLEETKYIEKTDQTALTTTKTFELPNVNIEKRTGNLFSTSQVKAKDSRIKYDLIDGQRKFYTPIWGDLGTYPLDVKNVDPLGIHKINVSMKQNLEIYAFMYGHMDSTTGKQDAIYLRPINSDDPKYPDNWSTEDKSKFKKWNKN
ncbi:hypothetical protein MPH61_23350 [Peribacillus muralis]|uniref:thioester domain-containing protein n=1 Tax=Peribacillus muralis TaxID=264697 RepID=UPI001F4E5F2C|nr:thioester domain-containing protein [Peribacillus muralis]MCK1995462.1 hypothetical protein [Peribacillus muralis]MCK2016045.1 hypothetical protein [Peribacillus muralis]